MPNVKAELEKLQGSVDAVARTMRGVQDHTLKVAEAYQRISKPRSKTCLQSVTGPASRGD